MKRNATCAVVGSSRLLLASDAGRAIDDADEVIRVNGAPATRRLRAHVGARTTMQVFGVYPTRLVGSRGIRVVLYCSPVWWVGQCWNAIPFDDYERMSVDAWRSVHAEVRPRDRVLNKTRVEAEAFPEQRIDGGRFRARPVRASAHLRRRSGRRSCQSITTRANVTTRTI